MGPIEYILGFVILVVAFTYPVVFRVLLDKKPIIFILIFLFVLDLVLPFAILKYVFIGSAFMILLIIILYVLYNMVLFKKGIIESFKVLSNKFAVYVNITDDRRSRLTLLQYLAIKFCEHRAIKFPNSQTTTKLNVKTTEDTRVKIASMPNNSKHTKNSFYNISLFGYEVSISKQIVHILLIGLLIFIVSQNIGAFIMRYMNWKT